MEPQEFIKLNLKDNLKKMDVSEENYNSLLDLQSFFRKNDWSGNKKKDLCSHCGSDEIYCGYAEVKKPETELSVKFWHICLNCLDIKHVENDFCFGQSIHFNYKCPICVEEYYKK